MMYDIRYKPEQGRIKQEKHMSLQKFKEALNYMAKCSDLDMKQIWFGCLRCGVWICFDRYTSSPVIIDLKNPLKREAYYYCKECAKEAVKNDAEKRKQKKQS
jgi:hypothetical protein